MGTGVRAAAMRAALPPGSQLAERMMASGRVMHWRGHNPLLADHVLGRA